jgi:hypothetical protein
MMLRLKKVSQKNKTIKHLTGLGYLLSHPLDLFARHIRRIPPARRLGQQSHALDFGDALFPRARRFGLRFDGFGVLRFEGGDHGDGGFDLGFDDCGAVREGAGGLRGVGPGVFC